MKKLILGRFLQIASIIGLVTPLVVFVINNKDKYIKTTNDVTKISIGLIIGIAYALVLVLKVLKEMNHYIKPLISLVVFALITYFLKPMINDLFMVLVMVIIGYAVFLVLITIANHYIEYGKEYAHQKVREQAKQDFEEKQEKIKKVGNV